MNASVSLDAIRDCLEGAIPANIATCAPDGTPNVSYISQVHYVDSNHVALTFQFFNKTHENVMAQPRAAVLVIHPLTAARFRMELEYLRTETEGPLFESMKAKLAGIASHTGMVGVFKLRGADVYRVHEIAQLPGHVLPAMTPPRNLLASMRACAQVFTRCADLGTLLEDLLEAFGTHLGVSHAMVLMHDAPGRRLFTVASRGYPHSGVGSEIALGCGVIGVAVEQRTPIRICYMSSEYSYGRAMRESAERAGLGSRLETAIPLPGLADSASQLAVPIVAAGELLGALYVESTRSQRFSYDDEDVLVAVAAQLGMAIRALQVDDGAAAPDAPAPPAVAAAGEPLELRHYGADDSVFLDNDYLIKGVAGAILRRLASEYIEDGRTEFTNRELRLDSSLHLPDLADNLEARLVLLTRRLAERSAALRLEKIGRGRFRLCVNRPLRLVEMPR